MHCWLILTAEAYFNLAILFLIRACRRLLKKHLKAAQLQPKNAKNFFNLAHVHNQQGNIKEAENDLKTAVNLDENYAEAFHLLAQIYHKKGATALALSSFEKSIRSKPDYPEAYNNMSNVLWDLGRAEDAIEALERAVTLNPGLFGAASKKAYFLASKNICGTKCYLDEVNRLNRRIREKLASVCFRGEPPCLTGSDWDLCQVISAIIPLVISWRILSKIWARVSLTVWHLAILLKRHHWHKGLNPNLQNGIRFMEWEMRMRLHLFTKQNPMYW